MKKIMAVILAAVLAVSVPVSASGHESDSIITFGFYEQDGNLENGPEPIEWIVLDRYEDGTLLIISRYGLDNKIMNKEWELIAWEDTDLRRWLNNEFLMEHFTPEERDRILLTKCAADRNPDHPDADPGNDTEDKVFCLSVAEAKKYFACDADRGCIPTPYAVQQGVYRTALEHNCWWWLRTVGNRKSYACVILGAGTIYTHGYCLIGARLTPPDGAVRPAMRIK